MAVTPTSIEIHETERHLVDPDLDFEYIDGAAADVAEILDRNAAPAELVYQPGDGTRYPLVIVPLHLLEHARPRVVGSDDWERHAVSGMASKHRPSDDAPGELFYEPNAYLVCWVSHACYPLRLGRRGYLHHGYIGEHWNTTNGSAVSLALLFRAISYYLDKEGA